MDSIIRINELMKQKDNDEYLGYLHLLKENIVYTTEINKLKEAQELIKKIYSLLGSSAEIDYNIWYETKAYCIENGLIENKKVGEVSNYTNKL